MAYENLLYEVADGIATITVNRPQALNTLTYATLDELDDAIRAARDEESVR
ncbi:MAG: enoyl-CoA hydratase-related protein [Candidatus Methylomirabilales bacterium]